MANVRNMEHLLHNTQKIVDHHHKMMIAKGEHFNLFSILGIESRENKTHSAFLAELLNPKGSHLKKEVFLKLFLQVVSRELSDDNSEQILLDNFINTTRTEVETEFVIGKRDDAKKEGGRLDISISNGKNFLCIENKIYAPDQNVQIQRYCNYDHGGENTVFYLTLKGSDPKSESKGDLESGIDFFNISYKVTIVNWLELCLKEVPNHTYIRESINQYILLIKKLTNVMNVEEDKELQELILKNLEESRYIAEKYENVTNQLKVKLRNDIRRNLLENLGSDFEIKSGRNIGDRYSKLWIQPVKWIGTDLKFAIEPFSGKGNKDEHLFVGLYDKKDSLVIQKIPKRNSINKIWKQTEPPLTKDGNKIKIKDMYTLEILSKPNDKEYMVLVNEIIKQTSDFVKDYENVLPGEIVQEN